MFWLSDKIEFPPYTTATKEGVIALGGDLSVERLLVAYKSGIFPWFCEGEPIVWYCPPTRMVLFPDELKVSKSMKQFIKKNEFTITENQAFKEVIYNCKTIARNEEFGTWITDDMQQAYIDLHQKGIATSIEVWKDYGTETQQLVGGLYGVDLGTVFCGESMFAKVSNVSKWAFIYLVEKKKHRLIDCQMYSDHLASLGAREISRDEFLMYLK